MTAAVATGVLGFALQDILSSILAGVAISIEKPFKVGDWVRYNGADGRVEQISWRSTRLRTLQDTAVVVPNSSISKSELVNYSHPDSHYYRETVIGVDYRHPPEKVMGILLSILQSAPDVIQEPPPAVRMIGYGESSINYRMRYTIPSVDNGAPIESGILSMVWYAFKRNKIKIPFPICDVRLSGASATVPDDRKQWNDDLALTPVSPSELGAIPAFSTLTPAQKRVICLHLDRIFYGKNETVFHAGTPGDHLYMIRKGAVVATKKDNHGRTQAFPLHAGHIFGEMSMITGEVRTADIVCTEETELLCMHRDRFRAIYKRYPALARRIAEIIEERMRTSASTALLETGEKKGSAKKKSLFESLRRYLSV